MEQSAAKRLQGRGQVIELGKEITFQEAICTICNEGRQMEAVKLLFRDLEKKAERETLELISCKAQLRLIKKLNRGKSAEIDALCEIEGGEQK